jgi:hypothetical protein
MQIDSANHILNQTRPAIVVFTNYICKSSCSVITKLLSIFPSTIIVGKEV